MNRFFWEWLLPLTLSGGLTALLILLMGLLPERARPDPVWHYRAGVAALLLFLVPIRIPVDRLFPKRLPELILPVSSPAAIPAAGPAAAQAAQEAALLLPDPMVLLGWVWLLGCAVGLLLAAGPSVSFWNMLRRECRPVTTPWMLEQLAQCRAKLKIRREIPLLCCKGIGSPVLTGLFSPKILIDDVELSQHELRFVLLHELTHYRNGDLLWRHLALLVRILHWYHPLARMLAKRIGPMGEVACDAVMTRPMHAGERREYSLALLDLIGRTRDCPPVTAGLAQGPQAMQKRLALILDGARPSRRRLLAGGAGLCVALLLGVTCSALLAPANSSSPAAVGGADGPTEILLLGPHDDGLPEGLMNQLLSSCGFDAQGGAVLIEVPEQLPAGWKVRMTIRETKPEEENPEQTWDLTLSKPGGFSFGVELGQLSRCDVALWLCDEYGTLLVKKERSWENPAQRQTNPGGLILPVANGEVSSGYGSRYGGTDFHRGVDYSCEIGTPVYAAATGTVVWAAYNTTGYGNYIVIDHGGKVNTLYGHNSELLVKEGDWVEQGQIIARSGQTGNATGPVCHFGLRLDGEYIDPTDYFVEPANP